MNIYSFCSVADLTLFPFSFAPSRLWWSATGGCVWSSVSCLSSWNTAWSTSCPTSPSAGGIMCVQWPLRRPHTSCQCLQEEFSTLSRSSPPVNCGIRNMRQIPETRRENSPCYFLVAANWCQPYWCLKVSSNTELWGLQPFSCWNRSQFSMRTACCGKGESYPSLEGLRKNCSSLK